MAGRVLAFADKEIIRIAKEDYIAVAGDDWYQRRRDDEEGRFFRKVADQGPRKGQGGSTRQGIYVFTADGRLLIYKNAQDAAVMRDAFKQGLERWKKLPEEERKPGAVAVPKLEKRDPRYLRTPPPRGLILNVYTRCLDRDESGEFCHAECKVSNEAAHDHLWLTEAEWKSLIPEKPRAGEQTEVAAAIVERIARFHLVDNTRGEPPHYGKGEVRSASLTLTVEKANAEVIELKLDGKALVSTSDPPEKSERGFDGRFAGKLEYDVKKGAIRRFDFIAIGEHWGEGTYTRGARPGRTPLGIAFELARGDQPADLVPPQAARDLGGYLGGQRPGR